LTGTTIWAWPERYPLIKAEGLLVGLVTTRDRVTVRSALSDVIQLVSTAAGEESAAGGDTAGADGAGADEAFWDPPEQAIPATTAAFTMDSRTACCMDFLT
jgi:hypothetical protein